jgi:hypothetical protein
MLRLFAKPYRPANSERPEVLKYQPMKKVVLIAILFAFINHIKAQTYQFPFGKARKPSTLDTTQYYFPLFKSRDNIMPDTATVIRHSAQLKALGEPIIFYNNTTDRIYRFTWLRSNDNPIAIRIVLHDHHTTLYWKECDPAGKLIIDKQKEVDNSAWHKFGKLTSLINTCTPDTGKHSSAGTSEWILECEMGGYYQYEVFYSPGTSTSYYKCCDYLIGLTDLDIPADRKY